MANISLQSSLRKPKVGKYPSKFKAMVTASYSSWQIGLKIIKNPFTCKLQKCYNASVTKDKALILSTKMTKANNSK